MSALLLAALFAAAGQRPASELPTREVPVRVDGAKSLLPLASALRNAYRDQWEDAEVALGAGLGAEAQLAALADGAIDIAIASPVPDPADFAARGLAGRRVAVTAVVFAVHADVGVLDLAPRDLCDIYSGKIANWDALGGASIPIRPFLRPEAETDMQVARAGIPCLKNLAVGRSIEVARTAADMRAVLQSTPGALGIATAAAVRQSIVALRTLAIGSVPPTPENVLSGRYPLVLSAYFVTLASPPPAVGRFLEFVLSARGASAILQAGALPVP